MEQELDGYRQGGSTITQHSRTNVLGGTGGRSQPIHEDQRFHFALVMISIAFINR